MADTCERRQRRKGLGRKNLTILRNLGQVDGGGGCPSTKVTSKGTGLPSDPSLAQSSAKISLGGLRHCGLTVKSGDRSSARSRLPHHLVLLRPHLPTLPTTHLTSHVTHHTNVPSTYQPRTFHPCWSLCLECFALRYLPGRPPYFL